MLLDGVFSHVFWLYVTSWVRRKGLQADCKTIFYFNLFPALWLLALAENINRNIAIFYF